MADTAHPLQSQPVPTPARPAATREALRWPQLAVAPAMPRPAEGFWRSSLRRLWRNRIAMLALAGLALILILSFSAPLIAQVRGLDRDAMDLLNNYQRPNAKHWFGTDEYGRDYFIRLLYGGQISIMMGFSVALVILAIGVPLGLIAGYYGGLIDDIFNWVVQIMVTTPTLFVLILVAAWIPPTPLSLALIIGAFNWMGNARQARGLTMQVKRMDYVLAAQALGASHTRIMVRHIMPNIVSLMIVLAGFDVVAGILAETGLSFLGLGIRPPLPSWGNMLHNALNYAFKAPHLVVFPGLAVGFLVLCVYMLADGLRDAFDPRLRE